MQTIHAPSTLLHPEFVLEALDAEDFTGVSLQEFLDIETALYDSLSMFALEGNATYIQQPLFDKFPKIKNALTRYMHTFRVSA